MRPPNICNEEERLAYIPYLLAQEQEKHDRRSRNQWVDAARCGDLDRVKSLRDNVDDINGCDGEGETALGAAASRGHLEIVQWLVEQGANIDAHWANRMTPLMLACIFSHQEISLWLIGQGANVNAQNEQGMTPLHYAAEKGDIEVLRLLLSKRAHPDGKNSVGVGNAWTPLQSAVRYGRLEVVRVLRKSGAVWPEDTLDGSTLLHLAARSGNARMAQWLLAEGLNELDSTDDEGQTPAAVAGWNGNETIRRYLLACRRWRQSL